MVRKIAKSLTEPQSCRTLQNSRILSISCGELPQFMPFPSPAKDATFVLQLSPDISPPRNHMNADSIANVTKLRTASIRTLQVTVFKTLQQGLNFV